MTIIDKTVPKAAKFVYKPVDVRMMTAVERERHYDTEWGKCLVGTNSDGTKIGYTDDGLTPLQYFFYTMMPIKLQGGKIGRPLWRNDDEELLFLPIKQCMDSISDPNGEVWDFMDLKRRRYGHTELLCKGIPMYYAFTHQGTNTMVTSADLGRISDIFKNKIFVGLDNMDMHNPFFPKDSKGWLNYKGASNKSGAYATIMFPKVDEHDEDKESTIYGVETVLKPDNVEGLTLIYGSLDEIGLHKHPTKVKASTDAALKIGIMRRGWMSMGGTCGEMTPENSKALANMVKDSIHSRTLVSFILGYHAVDDFTVNGWTDHKKAIEWIESDRERKYKLTDKTEYYKAIKDYPLNPDEIFDTSQGCALPEYLQERWKHQYAITVKREAGKFGTLHRDLDNGYVKFTETKDGKFFFHRPPIEGNKHALGCDPIPHNQAEDNGSEAATAAKDLVVQDYIGYYAERAEDANIVFENNILLQDYVNFNHQLTKNDRFGKIMIEKNQGGSLLQKFVETGMENRLAKKPKVFKWVNVKYGESDLRYGWQKAANAPYAYGFTEDYFNKHMEDIHIMRALEEMKWWKKQNHDLLDAMVSCEVYCRAISTDIEKEDESTTKIQVMCRIDPKTGRKIYYDVNVKTKYL